MPILLLAAFLLSQTWFNRSVDRRPTVVQCALQTEICDREFDIVRDSNGAIVKLEFPIKDGNALVLYQNYGTAEAMLDSERGQKSRNALAMFLARDDFPAASQKKYVVLGTADLAEVQKNFDKDGVCDGRRATSLPRARVEKLPSQTQSNDCLAYMRAFYVGEAMAAGRAVRLGDIVELGYDPTPFMEEANDRTGGDLFRALGLEDVVRDLRSELEVPPGATHVTTSSDKALQAQIKKDRAGYDKKFFPFRSVVVLAVRCPDVSCDAP